MDKTTAETTYSAFCCPVCAEPLAKEGKTCRCSNGHSFDYAKSGYLNLLPPNARHSSQPGDNKLMVDARRAFLAKGYYQPLLKALADLTAELLPKASRILDAGCGEGYYTGGVARVLKERGLCPPLFGVDISKAAVDKAARQNRTVEFAVASVFHLPVATHFCGMLWNLFAPYYQPEIERVLTPGGIFLMVIPGEEHLWELKEFIYQQPYKNDVKDFSLAPFRLIEHRSVETMLSLDCAEDIDNLFKMTPYYYKTAREDYERLLQLDSFRTRAQFELLAYRYPERAVTE